ncbi:hypothetical protein MY10362_008586 [Beauveria mimosiformis]
MSETAQTGRPGIRCKGCANGATTLQCPNVPPCLKLSIKDSFFCSHDCFKKTWNTHKALHKSAAEVTRTLAGSVYNPFPSFHFTGSARPVYPLSPRHTVPKSIQQPDYADTGVPTSERMLYRAKIDILDSAAQQAMRRVCKLSRQVLDIVAAELRPAITTEYLGNVCHKGYHADLNETYYVGDKAKADPENVRLIKTTRECLDAAIKIVKPKTPIGQFGEVIDKMAKERGCSVVSTWGGHVINRNFQPPP